VKDLVVTINAGKLISRKFLYLESELLQLAESCRQNEARLRVLFEPEILQQDMVLIGVRLCKRTAVDGMDLSFRKTGADFHLGVARYVLHHAKGKLQVRVHCPKLDLQAAEQLRDAGVHGAVTASAPSLMTAWKAEIARARRSLRSSGSRPRSRRRGPRLMRLVPATANCLPLSRPHLRGAGSGIQYEEPSGPLLWVVAAGKC
jgi:hypothetical protein